MTYWIYVESETGKKYLQTSLINFAGGLSYLCRKEYYVKKSLKGDVIYSFTYEEKLEEIAKTLIVMKNENYRK